MVIGATSSRAVLPLAIAALLSATCSESGLSPDPDTGLDIRVLKGPIQPVEREGDPPNEAPVEDALVEVRTAAGREVARAVTDARGEARVDLAAGTYQIEVLRCPGAMSLPGPEEVDVPLGSYREVRLDCDTGIR